MKGKADRDLMAAWIALTIVIGIVCFVVYSFVHWFTMTPTTCGDALAVCHNTAGWRCSYVDEQCKGVVPR